MLQCRLLAIYKETVLRITMFGNSHTGFFFTVLDAHRKKNPFSLKSLSSCRVNELKAKTFSFVIFIYLGDLFMVQVYHFPIFQQRSL
jgi:hypothetical protein